MIFHEATRRTQRSLLSLNGKVAVESAMKLTAGGVPHCYGHTATGHRRRMKQMVSEQWVIMDAMTALKKQVDNKVSFSKKENRLSQNSVE